MLPKKTGTLQRMQLNAEVTNPFGFGLNWQQFGKLHWSSTITQGTNHTCSHVCTLTSIISELFIQHERNITITDYQNKYIEDKQCSNEEWCKIQDWREENTKNCGCYYCTYSPVCWLHDVKYRVFIYYGNCTIEALHCTTHNTNRCIARIVNDCLDSISHGSFVSQVTYHKLTVTFTT